MASEEHPDSKEIGGWQIDEYISRGKSAKVYRANRNNAVAAIKVFESELVKEQGAESVLARIRRAREAGMFPHPNLVTILDGGTCEKTGRLFLVMDLLDSPTLTSTIPAFPTSSVRSIIRDVAAAAKHLEDHGAVHRDIKPDNVSVENDLSKATLLDLGVLRPIGVSDLTDTTVHQRFVGTLRYAPPEFALREEEDSADGWRAVTFYQLGGLLHDMIMRRPLFHEFAHVHGKLVQAIINATPQVSSSEVDADLVLLARSCLTKDPRRRLDLVSWESFFAQPPTFSLEASRALATAFQTHSLPSPAPTPADRSGALERAAARVSEVLRLECRRSGAFPPCAFFDEPAVHGDRRLVAVHFGKSGRHSLPSGFVFCCRLSFADQLLTLEVAASLKDTPSSPPQDQMKFLVAFLGAEDENWNDSILAALYQALVAARATGEAFSENQTLKLGGLAP